MLLTFRSMVLEPSAGVVEPAGTKAGQLCGHSLLLHTSNINSPWRSNVRFCPHFLDTMGFPFSSTLKRT
jgi:hypothetical protein